MPKKPINFIREIQNLTDMFLKENLGTDPTDLTRHYTDNFFQRTLAHLLGKGSTQSHLLKCNEAGELIVATTGAAYEDNDTKAGNAPDAYAGAIEFDEIVSRIDIFVWDEAMMFKRSPDGVRWNDEFEIPANGIFSIDAVCHSFDIENESAGDTARYSIVGWY